MSWTPTEVAHSGRVVLGSLLLDIENLPVTDKLAPEDFSPPAYGVFFGEIRAMARRGLPVDTSTLIGRFNEKKILELGGRGAIFELTEGLPRHYKDLPKHVDVILGEANKRRAQMAIFAVQKALDNGGDLEKVKQAFLEQFSRLKTTSKAAPSHARLIQLSGVQPRDVQWLWKPLLPLGMLAMVSGDSDVGKSFMLQAIAAGLTLGQLPCGGGPCEPVNILHLTNENSAEYTLRPRFDKLGGDPYRYFHCPGSEYTDDQGEVHTGAITLADIPMLDDALSRTHAKLVLIDPIQSYLPSKTDAHRANEVRQLLDPLAKLAEKHACCIVLIRHLSKGVGGKAIYRGSMSVDFTAAVRSEMLVGYLPDDHNKRAIVHIVHNVGPVAPSVGFEIDRDGEFRWTGQSDITAEQLLADPNNESSEVAGALREACEWLKDFLTPNSQDQQECKKQAEQNGISFATLKRAKARLGVKSHKASFKGGFVWFLPKADQGSKELEPVEPLRSNQHKEGDLDRFNELSHFTENDEDLSHIEGAQHLSHLDKNHEESQAGNASLSHFDNYNNNNELSVYSLVTKDEVSQVQGFPPRAREAVPNGFDPIA